MQTIATVSGTVRRLDQLGVDTEVAAGGNTAADPSNSGTINQGARQQLASVGVMRRLQARVEAPAVQWTRNQGLYVPQAEYKVCYDRESTTNYTLGSFCKQRDGPSIGVIIEWKNYLGNYPDSKKLALSRAERIADQLAALDKPSSFRTLNCVGWFLEESRDRCGLMFRVPDTAWPNPGPAPNQRPSLRVASLAQLVKHMTKPCLASRVRLAFLLSYSMLELHLARWLHKSFTASNILFFAHQSPEDQADNDWMHRVDLAQPYVASFGTARPDSSFEQSEPVSLATMVEAEYRHPVYVARTVAVDQHRESEPGARRMLQPRYHRAFDVYSLGCVLLEVFTWKQLCSLGWNTAYTNAPDTWRANLERVARRNVPFMAGPVVTEIIVRCLGARADPDAEGDLEAFFWDVVERLDEVRV